MANALWYYVNAQRERQGPVEAARVAALHAAGEINSRTLVWREGMPQWQPLERLAGELGISAGNASPPPAPPAVAAPAAPVDPAATRVLRVEPTLAAAPAPAPDAALNAAYAASARDASAVGVIDHEDVVDAGFLRRFAAYLIDAILLSIAMYALIFLMLIIVGVGVGGITELFGASAGGEAPSGPLLGVFIFGFYVLPILMQGAYHILFTKSAWQATPGKRAVGIKVVDLEGERIGTGRSAGRWFAAAVSYLTFYIGFLMAAFTDRKMALHDMIASTRVVDQWAYTDHPERQQRGLGGCAIAALVGGVLMILVFFFGIMAAISLPAYNDYTQRSQLAGVIAEAAPLKMGISEFVANTDRCPGTLEEVGLGKPAHPMVSDVSVGEIEDGSCFLQFELGGSGAGAFAGEYLWFTRDAQDDWRCGGSMDDKVLPQHCRG